MGSNAKRAGQGVYMAIRMAKDPAFRQQQAEYKKNNRKKRRDEIRALVAEFKSHGCSSCPEKDPCCLCAHHLRDKEFEIATAIRGCKSLEAVVRELQKCICLCHNCHAKLHDKARKAIPPVEQG